MLTLIPTVLDEVALQAIPELERRNGVSAEDVYTMLINHESFTTCMWGVQQGQKDFLVGYICYRFTRQGIRIRRVSVDVNNRFKGIGRKLVDEVIKKIMPKEVRALVHEENLDAQLFFKKIGFISPGYHERSKAFIKFLLCQ